MSPWRVTRAQSRTFASAARDFLAQAARGGLLLGELEPMHAEVVGATLQQRDAHRASDRARDGRQIAMEQLVLQGCACRSRR